MPSFPVQIRTSEDGAIYRLEEGDIIEWRQNGSSDLKRGRVTALQSKGGRDQDRVKPIRIAPIGINSAAIGGRERWISRWVVVRVYDSAGNAKSPIEEQEGLVSRTRMRRR
jgi:hypothetical protein